MYLGVNVKMIDMKFFFDIYIHIIIKTNPGVYYNKLHSTFTLFSATGARPHQFVYCKSATELQRK